MAAVVTPEDQACLDEHGYCVIKSVVDEAVATSIRSLIDDLLGPEPRETIDAAALGYQTYETLKSHGADYKWPRKLGDDPTSTPILKTGNHLHWVEHPIHDARAAAAVPAMAPLLASLLRCTDPERDLKLIHQNFRRTDPSPPPYPDYIDEGVLDGTGGGVGFHLDSAFLPSHYEATPRQNYYITLLALTPVVSGGAAFCYAPGSLAASKRAAGKLSPEQQAAVNPRSCRGLLLSIVQDAQVMSCRETAKEVTFEVGDMLVLDLMTTHAGSKFREDVVHRLGNQRHGLFSMWADSAAFSVTLAGLSDRNYASPAEKYTPEMKAALPAELRGLLEWTMPEETSDGLEAFAPVSAAKM